MKDVARILSVSLRFGLEKCFLKDSQGSSREWIDCIPATAGSAILIPFHVQISSIPIFLESIVPRSISDIDLELRDFNLRGILGRKGTGFPNHCGASGQHLNLKPVNVPRFLLPPNQPVPLFNKPKIPSSHLQHRPCNIHQNSNLTTNPIPSKYSQALHVSTSPTTTTISFLGCPSWSSDFYEDGWLLVADSMARLIKRSFWLFMRASNEPSYWL